MNVRLCYASQRNEKNEDLLQDLRDILTEARDFNDLNQICGCSIMPIMLSFNAWKVNERWLNDYLKKLHMIKDTTMLNGCVHIPLNKTRFNDGQ